MPRLKVKKCECTCYACPSQWDIFTEDGRYIYARYRWGYLQLTLTDSPITLFTDIDEVIFGESVGGGLDGAMNTKELKELTSKILDWDNE